WVLFVCGRTCWSDCRMAARSLARHQAVATGDRNRPGRSRRLLRIHSANGKNILAFDRPIAFGQKGSTKFLSASSKNLLTTRPSGVLYSVEHRVIARWPLHQAFQLDPASLSNHSV